VSTRKIPDSNIFFEGNFSPCCPVTKDEGHELAGKEVRKMKTMKSVLAVLFLAGAMGSTIATAGAEGVISKDALTEGSYCHLKFPAINEASLSTKHPFLKSPDFGDIIDFYGPCGHDPLGKDEINAQLLQLQHRRDHDYSS